MIGQWVRLHAEDEQAREVKASLTALPVGAVWVWSPGWLGLLRRVQIRLRRTFDSSATPRLGERIAPPTGFAPVDLDRLRVCLAASASGGTAPDAPPGTAAELAWLRTELQAVLDRPPRVEYVEVLSVGRAQLLREPAHQLHSHECTPTPTSCARWPAARCSGRSRLRCRRAARALARLRGRGVRTGRVRRRRPLTSVAAVEIGGRPAGSPPREPRPSQVVLELGELVELVATELVGISVVPVREATTRLSRDNARYRMVVARQPAFVEGCLVPPQVSALYRTIVVVDVAGFTGPARTMTHQRAVHEGLYNVLRAAFAEAGVDWGACKVEDRGDGAMILVPPEVAKSRLADQLPGRLIAELRRYNEVHSAEAAFQLRVGLHAGDVYQDEYGVVSQAVNFAFRILDASEAKSALKSSTGVLALIASDAFYHDVIVHDPAADPGSYRRILVKETSAVAWVRLPDGAAPADRVLDWLPATESQRLREWLDGITVSQLPTLVHRAAGPGVPPAPSGASAWEAFCYLADFNAGADGFPPALRFVELVARQVGGQVGTSLTQWNNDQARRLRLEPGLRARQEPDPLQIPVDSRLYLMIVVQPDGIDPDRYLLSHWRQDDPAEWPPARGDTRMVAFDELEQCVDDLVVSAERAWSGHGGAVALEFVLPRALLNLPVHRWHKEHDSGDPRPLCLDYPIVVRSLERMRSTHWHRVWHQRWQIMMNDPSAARVHFGQQADTVEPHRIAAVLSAPQWVVMVLTAPPPSQPQAGADELGAALRSGLPALVWHPQASPDDLRELVTRLIDGDGLGDLPGRAQTSRQAALRTSGAPFDPTIARDLVVLWDDPHRLVVLDQPSDQPQAKGDAADEPERAP